MEYLKAKLISALVKHFEDDYKRIDHALQVTHWAEEIGADVGADMDVVLSVAILHDTGIKEAERLHSSSAGHLQEKYGPAIVKPILENIGLDQEKTSLACAIVGSHHTTDAIPSIEFKVMWDADMLVNLEEIIENKSPEDLSRIIERSFVTEKGKEIAKLIYLAV